MVPSVKFIVPAKNEARLFRVHSKLWLPSKAKVSAQRLSAMLVVLKDRFVPSPRRRRGRYSTCACLHAVGVAPE